ncbi:hypothetical protein [Pseudomonas sp. O11]|uniref:hypothetical protein n=1 Tax=Pseudomonas sp. O11 TaxID=3159446 RepID=UPI00387A86C1
MSNEHPALNATGLSDSHCQLLLAVCYFVVIAFWSFGIAFNNAPDESTHFYLLEFLKAFHALPAASEPHEPLVGSISGHTWQKGEFWYHGLPFPHILGAMLTTYIGGWVLPSDMLYIAARSFNWLLGCVFICALFRTSRSLGLTSLVSVMIAGATALIPQVTFVFSYLNSDAYGLVSVALLISALISFTNSPTRKRSLYFGLVVGLMLMAKLYFIPALVFAGIMLLVVRVFKNSNIFAHFPTLIVAAILVSAPMLMMVYHTYGEVSGILGQIQFVDLHRLNPAAGFGTCYLLCDHDMINSTALKPWLDLTLRSYFSVTGWMNIFIPSMYYRVSGYILIGIACVAIFQVKPLGEYESKRTIVLDYALPLLMIIGLYPAMILLSLIASQNSLPQPQGRYLFVTIPFLGLLLSLTVKRLIERRAQ